MNIYLLYYCSYPYNAKKTSDSEQPAFEGTAQLYIVKFIKETCRV